MESHNGCPPGGVKRGECSMEDDKTLRGQVALITGGSSGLGRAAARALAAAGADVAVIARSSEDLDATVSQINASSKNGQRAMAMALDLADAVAITAAVEDIRRDFGPVTILVNAAGTDAPGPIDEVDVSDWDRVMNVNLRAAFLLAKAAFPGMREAGGGTIINIGSVAGRRGWANAGAYCASKFALTGLTQSLAAEGRDFGIRACLLYPGAMDTQWGAWNPSDRDQQDESSIPAERSLPPSHVAELITWIALAPREMVLNEVTVTPLLEEGWP